MIYRLHHLHLLCSDLEKTITFLSKTLGAALVERKKFGGADGATLNLNGTTINLRVAREDDNVSTGTSITQYGYHHIGLNVDNVDQAYRELSDKGYIFSITPKEVGKNRVAFFNGPDNITIELLQPLA
ncbi:MAG: VOC family protein [Deltaproteobacteria bacterium]|nr:VOC family protein [Deltaproteobacteria bacterium]